MKPHRFDTVNMLKSILILNNHEFVIAQAGLAICGIKCGKALLKGFDVYFCNQ